MRYLNFLVIFAVFKTCSSQNQADTIVFSGLESGYLSLSAYSIHDASHTVSRASPYFTPRDWSPTWCAAFDDSRQWLQFSSPVPFFSHKISIGGVFNGHLFVKAFQVVYTLDGKTWIDYENSVILPGNSEASRVVPTDLVPFLAIAVRLRILSVNGIACTKADLLISIPKSKVPTTDALVPVTETGMPIRASSIHDPAHDVVRIRINYDSNREGARAWVPAFYDSNQWVQVSSILPQEWRRIHIQGRADHPGWVRTFFISYTLNGKDWLLYEGGRVMDANWDQNTIRVIDLVPFVARSIRIRPVSWYGHIAMRLEAFYKRIN